MTKYKITITKTEDIETTLKSYQKVADSGNERDDGPVYDYVSHEDTERRETTILEQELTSEQWQDGKLERIIAAVNDLRPQDN